MKSLQSARINTSFVFSIAWAIFNKLNEQDQGLAWGNVLRISWIVYRIFRDLQTGKATPTTLPVSFSRHGFYTSFSVRYTKDAIFVSLKGDTTQGDENYLRLAFDRWDGNIWFAKFTTRLESRHPFNLYKSTEGTRLREEMEVRKAQQEEVVADRSGWTSFKFFDSTSQGYGSRNVESTKV